MFEHNQSNSYFNSQMEKKCLKATSINYIPGSIYFFSTKGRWANIAHPSNNNHNKISLIKSYTNYLKMEWNGYITLRFKNISLLKIRNPIVAPPYLRGSWFEKTWVYTTWESFHTRYSFSGQLVLRRFFIFSPKIQPPGRPHHEPGD